jgi:hypothetical protein
MNKLLLLANTGMPLGVVPYIQLHTTPPADDLNEQRCVSFHI